MMGRRQPKQQQQQQQQQQQEQGQQQQQEQGQQQQQQQSLGVVVSSSPVAASREFERVLHRSGFFKHQQQHQQPQLSSDDTAHIARLVEELELLLLNGDSAAAAVYARVLRGLHTREVRHFLRYFLTRCRRAGVATPPPLLLRHGCALDRSGFSVIAEAAARERMLLPALVLCMRHYFL